MTQCSTCKRQRKSYKLHMSERSVPKKQRGKRWYTILSPEEYGTTPLGETIAEDPAQVEGRTVEVTLGDLTDTQGANNTKLTFRVTSVTSDAAYTEFIRHELARDYLRSLIRRGASKISTTLTLLTADDYRVQIQAVGFTTKKAKRSQEEAIRKVMTDLITETATTRSFSELTESVVEGRLSSAIYTAAKEIYPLRRIEIAKLELDAHPAEVAAEEEAAVDVDAAVAE